MYQLQRLCSFQRDEIEYIYGEELNACEKASMAYSKTLP
jgi:hypothetical protein